MTREEEIRARLKNAETFDAVLPLNNRHHRGEIRSGKRIVARMEPETLHSLGDLLAHAPADIRYLLEKVDDLEREVYRSHINWEATWPCACEVCERVRAKKEPASD